MTKAEAQRRLDALREEERAVANRHEHAEEPEKQDLGRRLGEIRDEVRRYGGAPKMQRAERRA